MLFAVTREDAGSKWNRFSTGEISFLSPNQQCHSAEGNSSIESSRDLASSFMYQYITERSSVVPLLGVLICAVLCVCDGFTSLDHFQAEMLGTAELVEEVPTGDSKVIKVDSALNDFYRATLC